jgi:hypothetical protein
VLVDLGCGTLRGGIPIIEYLDADSYIGVDVREEAIEEARRFLTDRPYLHSDRAQETLAVHRRP